MYVYQTSPLEGWSLPLFISICIVQLGHKRWEDLVFLTYLLSAIAMGSMNLYISYLSMVPVQTLHRLVLVPTFKIRQRLSGSRISYLTPYSTFDYYFRCILPTTWMYVRNALYFGMVVHRFHSPTAHKPIHRSSPQSWPHDTACESIHTSQIHKLVWLI